MQEKMVILPKEYEDMSKHVSFKLGGLARYYIQPSSVEELKKILVWAKKNKIKFFILGNGTNTVFRDKGYKGIVISTKKLNNIYMDNECVCAECGVNMFVLNKFLKENSLTGLEWSYGIPGSVGGAVYMNAGAYGSEFSQFIEKVEVLKQRRKTILYKNDLTFDYRYSCFQNTKSIILKVWLKLSQGHKSEIDKQQKQYYQKRKESQPLEYANAGSIFKRQNNIIPAKIIDKLGLKGVKLNGVEVSSKHAGFIVKKSYATAMDLENLIKIIKRKVKREENVSLKTEIEFIGDK